MTFEEKAPLYLQTLYSALIEHFMQREKALKA